MGHVVLTAHLLEDNVETAESSLTEREVFERDMRWLNDADLLIAEASGSSYGVGFEVGYVLGRSDVTDQRATAAAVTELRRKLGTVDILVNNAGISGPVGPLWQAQTAEWWRAIEVNLGGAFVLTQLALAHMIPAGRGRIINITSYAGVYRWPLLSAYAASKAALVKLTENLAEETRPHGVSVFSVDPGLLPIGLGEAALRGSADRHTPRAVSTTGSATSSPPGGAPTRRRLPA